MSAATLLVLALVGCEDHPTSWQDVCIFAIAAFVVTALEFSRRGRK